MADDPTVNIDLDKLSNDALKERIELLKEKNKLEREAISGAQAEYEDASERNEEVIRQIEKNIAALQRKKYAGDKLTAAQEAELERGKQEVKMLQQQNKSHASSVAAIKKHEAALKDLNDEGEKFANILLGTNNQLGNFIKKMMGTKGGFTAFAKGLAGLLNPFKLLMSFITKVIQQTFFFNIAVDKARASFVKATGASRKFGNDIVALSHAMKGTGVRADELAKAQTSLYSGMQDFSKMNTTQRRGLVKTVSLFQELGVSTDTQAEILNEATKSLGYNATELEGVLLMVGGVADGLNEPMNKVMENFKTVSQKLAFYGKNIEGVFKNLSAQSKATGLSMDQLLGVVEQFDTFEGAGKAVGKLNAIMGGPYLNSIDMLNAKEDERVEILQRSMKQSGMNFKQMGKYEQKMIASSLGISPKEARKMFGAETESDKMEAMQAAKLAARQARSQDIQENMENMLEQFALDWSEGIERLRKLIYWVGCNVRNLLDWFEKLPPGQKVAVTLGGLLGTFVFAKLGTWLMKAGFTRLFPGAAAPPPGAPPAPGAPPPRGGRPPVPRPAPVPADAGRLGARIFDLGRKLERMGLPRFGERLLNLGMKLTEMGHDFREAINPRNWTMPRWMNPRSWTAPRWMRPSTWRMPTWLNPRTWPIPSFANPSTWPIPTWLTNALPMLKAVFGRILVGLDVFFLGLDAWGTWTNKAQDSIDRIGKVIMSASAAIALVVGAIISLPATLAVSAGMGIASLVKWGFTKAGLGFLFADEDLDPETHGKNIFEQSFVAARLLFEDSDPVATSGGRYKGMTDEQAMAQARARRAKRAAKVDDFIYQGMAPGPGTITPLDSKDQFIGMKGGGAIDRLFAGLKNSMAASPGSAGGQPPVINVYIGQRKIDQIVVDALNSPTGRRFLTGLND